MRTTSEAVSISDKAMCKSAVTPFAHQLSHCLCTRRPHHGLQPLVRVAADPTHRAQADVKRQRRLLEDLVLEVRRLAGPCHQPVGVLIHVHIFRFSESAIFMRCSGHTYNIHTLQLYMVAWACSSSQSWLRRPAVRCRQTASAASWASP